MFEKNYRNKPVEVRDEKVNLGENKLIKIEIDCLPTGTSL